MVRTIIGGGNTQTLLTGNFFELYALLGGGDAKTVIFPSSLSLALVLVLHMSHLVKL